MSLRQAAQQALEAWFRPHGINYVDFKPYMEALKQALAEPEQEPVAWRTFDGEGGYDYRTYEDNKDYAAKWAKRNPLYASWVEPLYTAPTPRKPLTDEEIAQIVGECAASAYRHDDFSFARAIERAHGIGEQT